MFESFSLRRKSPVRLLKTGVLLLQCRHPGLHHRKTGLGSIHRDRGAPPQGGVTLKTNAGRGGVIDDAVIFAAYYGVGERQEETTVAAGGAEKGLVGGSLLT